MKPSSCAHCVTRTPDRSVEYRGKTLWCCQACADEIEAAKQKGQILIPPVRLRIAPLSVARAWKAPSLDQIEDSQASVAHDFGTGLLTLKWTRKGTP